MEGTKWNHFMIILLLNHYFKIKSWIYRGILGVLVKNSFNLISFPLIPSNFGGMKIWDFKEIKKNELGSETQPHKVGPNEDVRDLTGGDCDAPIWLIIWCVWVCDESHIEYLLGWTRLY